MEHRIRGRRGEHLRVMAAHGRAYGPTARHHGRIDRASHHRRRSTCRPHGRSTRHRQTARCPYRLRVRDAAGYADRIHDPHERAERRRRGPAGRRSPAQVPRD